MLRFSQFWLLVSHWAAYPPKVCCPVTPCPSLALSLLPVWCLGCLVHGISKFPECDIPALAGEGKDMCLYRYVCQNIPFHVPKQLLLLLNLPDGSKCKFVKLKCSNSSRNLCVVFLAKFLFCSYRRNPVEVFTEPSAMLSLHFPSDVPYESETQRDNKNAERWNVQKDVKTDPAAENARNRDCNWVNCLSCVITTQIAEWKLQGNWECTSVNGMPPLCIATRGQTTQ